MVLKVQRCGTTLVPYVHDLHHRARLKAADYKVVNWNPADPGKEYAVAKTSQLVHRVTTVLCSIAEVQGELTLKCQGCEFYAKTGIPCEHLEALGRRTGLATGDKYTSWVKQTIPRAYLTTTVVASIDGATTFNPANVVAGKYMRYPDLAANDSACKKQKRNGRYMAYNESALTPGGNRKSGQRPPKQLATNPTSTSAQELVRRAPPMTYVMVRYQGAKNSTAKFTSGDKPGEDDYRPVRILGTGSLNVTTDVLGVVKTRVYCLLSCIQKDFVLTNIVDACKVTKAEAERGCNGTFANPNVKKGERARTPSTKGRWASWS